MALIRCPECGREISDKASACPGCGCPVEEFEQEEQQKAARELPPEERPEMMECVKCGRPLPKNIYKCVYCGYLYGSRNTQSGDDVFADILDSGKRHPSNSKVKCPYCGSVNINISIVSDSSSTKIRKGRATTMNWNHKVGVCQDCGNSWNHVTDIDKKAAKATILAIIIIFFIVWAAIYFFIIGL